MGGLIDRQAVLDALAKFVPYAICDESTESYTNGLTDAYNLICQLPTVQLNPEKYEYHYDHTDCIWYRPEARNRCPVTCAQYRDGWNDAMNYIFRDGKGYRPYRKDEQYGE